MNVALEGMPVLEDYCDMLPGHFSGINVLYVNHLISDSLMVGRAFRHSGADLWTVGIPYGDVSHPARHAVIAGFHRLGRTIVPSVTAPLDFTRIMEQVVRSALEEVIDASIRSRRKFMIVEDGGYAFPLLHDDPQFRRGMEFCIGAVEHTSRGLWNYQFMETDDVGQTPRVLRRPAVSIAQSLIKTVHEPPFVAQAMIDELGFLLKKRHEFLRYRNIGVIGCGRVGMGLAIQLDALDSRVFVVETSAERRAALGRRHANLRIFETLDDVGVMNADLILGASGVPSFGTEHLRAFLAGSRDSLSLASASSKMIEFSWVMRFLDAAAGDPDLLERETGIRGAIERVRVPEFGIDYRIASPSWCKRLTILADGYPVIFFPGHTHGAPNRPMDPIMTELYLAACWLRSYGGSMSPVVHTLDMLKDTQPVPDTSEPWMDLIFESRILKRWCAHNGIDYPGYARQRGFVDTDDRMLTPPDTEWYKIGTSDTRR